MATLASLISTQAGTVSAGNAAFAAQIDAICVYGVLVGHRINDVADLASYIQAAAGVTDLAAYFPAQRRAGDVVREGASG